MSLAQYSTQASPVSALSLVVGAMCKAGTFRTSLSNVLSRTFCNALVSVRLPVRAAHERCCRTRGAWTKAERPKAGHLAKEHLYARALLAKEQELAAHKRLLTGRASGGLAKVDCISLHAADPVRGRLAFNIS